MHVEHLVVAYVHHQLSRAQSARLLRHTARCTRCRAALADAERLAADMRATFRTFGQHQPAPGQVAARYGAVMAAVNVRPARPAPWALGLTSSFGAMLATMLACMLIASALFSGGRLVIAAPLPPVPAQVQATWTPIYTRPPNTRTASPSPIPSLASLSGVAAQPPLASPVPPADRVPPGGR